MKNLHLLTLICLVIAYNVYIAEGACQDHYNLIGVKTMSSADKKRLLFLHNKFRDLIASGKYPGQPPAENMLELTWDTFAEKQAKDLASTCLFQHDRPTDARNKPMGQNLSLRMYTAKENVNSSFDNWVKSLVDGWLDEVKAYTFGQSFTMDTGHYTQVVWAETGSVGCGYSYSHGDNIWYKSILVCNYSPAGNYIGQKPYITGKPNCKKHNLKSSSKYKSLCVKK